MTTRIAALAATLTLACARPAKTVQQPAPATPAAAPAPAVSAPSSQDTAKSTPPGPGAVSSPLANPFPSTYKPVPSRPTYIYNLTILTAAGPTIQRGAVLLMDGKIAAVGTGPVDVPANALRIDGAGKYLTPGIIDVHSHL